MLCDFIVVYSFSEPFPRNPTLCDVCTGKDFNAPELLNGGY